LLSSGSADGRPSVPVLSLSRVFAGPEPEEVTV
jgi:hypothetical protein